MATEKFKVAITYSTWTEEDYEHGDTDDKGWELDYTPATLEDIKHTAERYGIAARDKNDFTSWWSAPGASQDYGAGESTYYDMHVTRLNGRRLTDREFTLINRVLGAKHARRHAKRPPIYKGKKTSKRRSQKRKTSTSPKRKGSELGQLRRHARRDA